MEPFGVLTLYAGPNAGTMTYGSGSVGGGWIGANVSINTTKYYYWGNRNDLSLNNFIGWNSGEINASVSVGLDVGGTISYVKTKSGGYLIGVTTSLGVGVSPSMINGYLGRTNTKKYKKWTR